MAPHVVQETCAAGGGIQIAEYVRISTDHQKYSTANQAATIREYAEMHGMEVVRTYGGDGKSGLEIGRRTGFKLLLDDVTTGHLNCSAILVYDISRWGRFQNSDLCTKAGVRMVWDHGPCAVPGRMQELAGVQAKWPLSRPLAGDPI